LTYGHRLGSLQKCCHNGLEIFKFTNFILPISFSSAGFAVCARGGARAPAPPPALLVGSLSHGSGIKSDSITAGTPFTFQAISALA
ncbi:MAG: hypothetical protein J6K02_04165, partial [Alistipes sp.]|uniref:hypothetical protein n=1 Tax=Alistipes sp. TaxID=1872444 RepID=UPI001B56A8C0